MDYESIPIVDLEQIQQTTQNIVIVSSSEVEQCMSLEGGDLSGSEYYEQFMQINELPTGFDSDYSSSDDELNASKSSELADSDLSSDVEAIHTTAENTTQIVDRKTIDTDVVSPNTTDVASNVEVTHETDVNSSNIPLGTPAAFAKVLFYPGEQHLSANRKRSGKKRKIPAVYSSEQYSGYLRQKQTEKEECEKMKAQRKLKRELEKQRKEDEKKDREAKKLAKMEAIAIKKAELTEKKASLAMKKDEEAARKAEDAAKKSGLKKGSSSGATAPKRKRQKLNPKEPSDGN